MTITDRELMHRVGRGDERAFTELADRYGARLLTVAWRLLGNRADAEDAVQRALLRLFTSAKSYRSEWAVSTWLYRVMTNVCVDEMRRRHTRSALAKAAHAEATADGQGLLFRPGGGHGGAVARSLDMERALTQVPIEARILLTLRYVDGLSYQELARVRGVSVNTVKSQLARGKSILRGALGGGARRRGADRTTTKGDDT